MATSPVISINNVSFQYEGAGIYALKEMSLSMCLKENGLQSLVIMVLGNLPWPKY